MVEYSQTGVGWFSVRALALQLQGLDSSRPPLSCQSAVREYYYADVGMLGSKSGRKTGRSTASSPPANVH